MNIITKCIIIFLLCLVFVSCKQLEISGLTLPETQVDAKKNPVESAFQKLENSSDIAKASLTARGVACLSPRESKLWNGSGAEKRSLVEQFIEKGISDAVAPFMALGGLAASTVDRLTTAVDKDNARKPICGNWCGAQRGLRKDSPPAVDELDNLCRQHDLCYRSKGQLDCGCDQALLDAIERNGRSTLDSMNMQKILAYYRGSVCRGGCKISGGIRVCGNYSAR